MYFLKRQAEPQEMDKIEHETFSRLSQENYNRWFIPLVDDILSFHLPSDAVILDIGSGPGLLAKEIGSRSQQFKVIGIDISKDTLRIAHDNNKNCPNLSFIEASVYNIPFNENSFDLVVCKDSLHHFNDLKKALKEMWRVLRPGGVLYIQDLRRDVPMYLLKRSIPKQTVVQKLQYYSVRAAYTKSEIKNYLNILKPISLIIKTRKVTRAVDLKYKNLDIDSRLLREAFQSRYIAIARK
jgi:ubiquinone/menaquinone biosynthesis C-methylase UbiE